MESSCDAAHVFCAAGRTHHEPNKQTAQPPAGSQLRRRSPATKLAATSQAGAALHSALETAKAQLAKSEVAAAASAEAARYWAETGPECRRVCANV